MNVSVDFRISLDNATIDLFNRYYQMTLARRIKINRTSICKDISIEY